MSEKAFSIIELVLCIELRKEKSYSDVISLPTLAKAIIFPLLACISLAEALESIPAILYGLFSIDFIYRFYGFASYFRFFNCSVAIAEQFHCFRS